MRKIEGIDNAISILEPHWKEIQAHFDEENARFIALAAADHDVIGRVLRAHLVIEHYMNSFLVDHYSILTLAEARLSFFQKATLLPQHRSQVAFVRPGILQLNALRNKFGHKLRPEIINEEIGAIYDTLRISGREAEDLAPIAAIEAFTPLACTFLSITPKHLQELFAEAFAQVRPSPSHSIC